jgi:hypothetical protein
MSIIVGSIARIGPNLLVTDDAAFLRRISAARSPYTRGEWYNGVKLDPDINNTISEKDEERHTELRAKVANGVISFLQNYTPHADSQFHSTLVKATRVSKPPSTIEFWI